MELTVPVVHHGFDLSSRWLSRPVQTKGVSSEAFPHPVQTCAHLSASWLNSLPLWHLLVVHRNRTTPTAATTSSSSLAVPSVFLRGSLWSGSHLLQKITPTAWLLWEHCPSCTVCPGITISIISFCGEPWWDLCRCQPSLGIRKLLLINLNFLRICVDEGNLPLPPLRPTNRQPQAVSSLCGPEINKKALSDVKQGSPVFLSQQPKTIARRTHLTAIFTLSGVTL